MNDVQHTIKKLTKHISSEKFLFKKLTSAKFPYKYIEKSQFIATKYLINSKLSFICIKYFDIYNNIPNIIATELLENKMLIMRVVTKIIIYIGNFASNIFIK